MKHPMITALAVLVTSLPVQGAEPKTGPDTPAAEKTNPTGQWRSEPPAVCPFKPSASTGKRNPDGQGFAVFARAQIHAQAEARDNAANRGIQRVIGDIVSGSDEN